MYFSHEVLVEYDKLPNDLNYISSEIPDKIKEYETTRDEYNILMQNRTKLINEKSVLNKEYSSVYSKYIEIKIFKGNIHKMEDQMMDFKLKLITNKRKTCEISILLRQKNKKLSTINTKLLHSYEDLLKIHTEFETHTKYSS